MSEQHAAQGKSIEKQKSNANQLPRSLRLKKNIQMILKMNMRIVMVSAVIVMLILEIVIVVMMPTVVVVMKMMILLITFQSHLQKLKVAFLSSCPKIHIGSVDSILCIKHM